MVHLSNNSYDIRIEPMGYISIPKDFKFDKILFAKQMDRMMAILSHLYLINPNIKEPAYNYHTKHNIIIESIQTGDSIFNRSYIKCVNSAINNGLVKLQDIYPFNIYRNYLGSKYKPKNGDIFLRSPLYKKEGSYFLHIDFYINDSLQYYPEGEEWGNPIVFSEEEKYDYNVIDNIWAVIAVHLNLLFYDPSVYRDDIDKMNEMFRRYKNKEQRKNR